MRRVGIPLGFGDFFLGERIRVFVSRFVKPIVWKLSLRNVSLHHFALLQCDCHCIACGSSRGKHLKMLLDSPVMSNISSGLGVGAGGGGYSFARSVSPRESVSVAACRLTI
jgi:hypothetical protein